MEALRDGAGLRAPRPRARAQGEPQDVGAQSVIKRLEIHD